MKSKIFVAVILSLLLSSCADKKVSPQPKSAVPVTAKTSSTEPSASTPVKDFTVSGEEVLVPDFKVKISLDKEVFDILKSKKESVIADYYFYGNVNDAAKSNPEVSKAMDLYGLKLLGGRQEISDIQAPEVVFDFKNLKFPKVLYDALESKKDVHLNINFYSGRKVFENNILDIPAFDASFNDVIKSNYLLSYNCKLLNPKDFKGEQINKKLNK